MEKAPKPLDPLQRTGLLFYTAYAQLPLGDSRIPLPANRYFLKLALDISQGKIASQSPAELRRKLFPDYQTQVEGIENIPQKGSFIVASNHYNLGPLKGGWQTTAIADIVSNGFRKRSFHFIMDDKKDSTGFFGEEIKRKFQESQSHVLHNIAATLSHIPLDQMKHVLELLRDKKESHIIGIFPTGKAEFAFETPAPQEVGGLFEIAGRQNIPVLPMGIWHDREKKIFIIKIGPAAIHTKDPKDPNSKEKTTIKVMRSIAELLPAEMRGRYA